MAGKSWAFALALVNLMAVAGMAQAQDGSAGSGQEGTCVGAVFPSEACATPMSVDRVDSQPLPPRR